jgi:FG-GAP-like repeat/IPT/TIG domain/Secretion system C-terminal sorting domain
MLKLYPGNGFLFAIVLLLPRLVFAQPVITAVSPLSGPVNTTVTITGGNFSASPSHNIVWFGSVKAPVTAATTRSLTVTVPAGGSYQPITVTSGGLTSTPFQPFITTFSDTGQFKPAAFTSRTDVPTGNGPVSIFSIDLDGDGKPDVIIADADSNIVSVYHNNSKPDSISFVQQGSYIMDADDYPIGVTAGDLDGDGKPDIVVSNWFSQTLSIFLNTSTPGHISMAAPISYPLGNYTLAASIADLNVDGLPEIIAASGDSVLSVYANNSTPGHLSFSPKVDYPLPAAPFKVAVADLDGDGMPDMAAASGNTNLVSVFRNTSSSGGAISFATHVDFPTGNNPQGLAIGDLDGDGKPDLAIVNMDDNTVSLLRNTGSSGTISFATHVDVPTGSGPYDLVIADLDGDGHPDLAVDDQYGGSVSVHRNLSTPGTIAISGNTDYLTGNNPYSIAAADLDGDAKPDLITANNTPNDIYYTFTVLRNKGSNEPAITAFSPNIGTAGTVVTITGVNLTGVSSVSFGDSAATSFTVVSPTTVTATVGGGATGAVSLLAVTGAASLSGFTYGTPPVINSFSPDSGASGATILIKGTGFTGANTLSFGGTPANTFAVLSDSVISAVVGVGSSGMVGVTSPAGSASLAGFSFIYTAIPPVQLVSFNPTSAGPGANITITGQHLSGITSISFGGTPVLSFRVLSDSVINVTLGPGSSGDLLVNGNNGTDSLTGFLYLTPPPPPPIVQISAFSPISGPKGATIDITGRGLTGATSVSFGDVPALSFSVINDSLILAVVGSGASGEVTVASNYSQDSISGFTYTYDSTRQSGPPAVFQLLQFSGAYAGNIPLLQWQTVNDAIIGYYAVERASVSDTSQFIVIATIVPSGANPGSHTYSFSDAGYNQGGTNIYRLKMQDTSVLYTYSATITVQPPGKSTLLSLYPNPVKYGFTYVTVPDATNNSWFQVVDMYGRNVKTQVVPANTPQVRLDLPGLLPGIYKVTWTDGTHSAYQAILILPQ